MKEFIFNIYRQKDKLWLLIWLSGIGLLWIWNKLYLNPPALARIELGFFYTVIVAVMVIVFSIILGWSLGVGLYFLENSRYNGPYLVATFLLNIIRSIPQIVGILIGYILITLWLQSGALRSTAAIILIIAFTISLFVFLEIVDLIRERIAYYKRLDFYNAMLVCGIRESRIINREILWKNSMAHIFNKLISVFGIAIFLLCSIDFIISVGLSTEVSSANLPVTLGSLLAKIDSKQDILAIGNALINPGYFSRLFFEHLQGITVAFLIVFTLLCIYKISNGFARRYEL
jgi:ABC-type dipeptide/oligopeptide/nickel transport system permease subunit